MKKVTLISVITASVLFGAGADGTAKNSAIGEGSTETQNQIVTLDTIEVNSVGDNISESGIDEGFLSKNVASGPLASKSVRDTPYSIQTISKEVLDNQGVQTFDELIKYFPSTQFSMNGGDMGRPQTRGFQSDVMGNVLWDGFYSVSTSAIPMAMFESLQVQNGLSGSLYGGQMPAGMFGFSRKRPQANYHSIRGEYISDGNFGTTLDISDKFEKVGYRGTFSYADGEREPSNSNTSRKLMSLALDFYPTDDLIFETNFSYYKHIMTGYYNSVSVRNNNGKATGEIPSFSSVQQSKSERFMRTRTASGKFKWTPKDWLYFEGGYQWQEAIRSRDGTARFTAPSAFLKALAEFNTAGIHHNFGISANGYRNTNGKERTLATEMKNISIVDDIAFNDNINVILSAANTWYKKKNYDKDGVSWAGSLIYKWTPDFNVYFTYADSLQDGRTIIYDSENGYTPSHPLYGQTVSLDPYRSKQYEIGAKARLWDTLDFSLALFQITKPIYYAANRIFGEQGDQRNRGVELMLGGKIADPLSVYGGITYLDSAIRKSQNTAVNGKTIIDEPKWQANVLFDYAVPYINKLAFTTNFHYTSKRYVDELNTKSVPSYVTADLGARYTVKNVIGKELNLRLNINNLFDKEYWERMRAPTSDGGEYASGQLLTGQTALFRGYGRTVMLSAEVKF